MRVPGVTAHINKIPTLIKFHSRTCEARMQKSELLIISQTVSWLSSREMSKRSQVDPTTLPEDDENWSPTPVGNIIFPKSPLPSSIEDPNMPVEVIVINLAKRRELNGRIGVVKRMLDNNNRVQVWLYHPEAPECGYEDISIKPDNLCRYYIYPSLPYHEEKRIAYAAAQLLASKNAVNRMTQAVMDFTVEGIKQTSSIAFMMTRGNTDKNNKTDKEKGNDLLNNHQVLALQAWTEYLNKVFHHLCYRDNNEILSKFHKLMSFGLHSEVCLLLTIVDLGSHLISMVNLPYLYDTLMTTRSAKIFDITTISHDRFVDLMNKVYDRQQLTAYVGLRKCLCEHVCCRPYPKPEDLEALPERKLLLYTLESHVLPYEGCVKVNEYQQSHIPSKT